MVMQIPIPSCAAAEVPRASGENRAPPAPQRPCIDALVIGRMMRPPQVGGNETGLVLAVNLASRALPGTYRRAEHATFLLVRAVGAAHRLFQLPGPEGLCGRLVRISHCALELMPFTTDYETIDHRLQGCFEQPEQFTVLTPARTRDGAPPATPATGSWASGR